MTSSSTAFILIGDQTGLALHEESDTVAARLSPLWLMATIYIVAMRFRR